MMSDRVLSSPTSTPRRPTCELVGGWNLGYTSHSRWDGDPNRQMSSVYVYDNVLPGRKREQFIRHHLMHAIGLAHDEFPESAVYQLVQDDSMEQRMGAAKITNHDVALLGSSMAESRETGTAAGLFEPLPG